MNARTDLLFYLSSPDDEAMEQVNAWCAENARGQQFERLDTTVLAGRHAYTASLWAMCGDYFPVEKLTEALPTFGWARPEQVQLIIDPVPDDRPPPSVYRIDKNGETWLE